MIDMNVKLHECLLKMVKDFHKICIENNLEYYIIGGTFLGAIRHKGFIPWDDDIDIGMPRDSYEKFVNLSASALPSYMSRMTNGYNKKKGDFLYLKLCNRNTTMVEDINEKRIEGVYIDIFPIDGAGNNILESKIRFYCSRLFIYSIWLNGSDKKRKNMLKRGAQTFFKIFDNRSIYKCANKILSRTKYSNNKYVGNFMGNWGIKEIMPKKYFGKPTIYKFEDTELYGPYMAHEFLSAVYGDYMKLPATEKQISHHTYELINFEVGYEEFYKKTCKADSSI